MPWSIGHSYSKGERVSFGGTIYECTMGNFASALNRPSSSPRIWKITCNKPVDGHFNRHSNNGNVFICHVCMLEKEQLDVVGCGHVFCRSCLNRHCKQRF